MGQRNVKPFPIADSQILPVFLVQFKENNNVLFLCNIAALIDLVFNNVPCEARLLFYDHVLGR